MGICLSGAESTPMASVSAPVENRPLDRADVREGAQLGESGAYGGLKIVKVTLSGCLASNMHVILFATRPSDKAGVSGRAAFRRSVARTWGSIGHQPRQPRRTGHPGPASAHPCVLRSIQPRDAVGGDAPLEES
jgi:hypothetical protein